MMSKALQIIGLTKDCSRAYFVMSRNWRKLCPGSEGPDPAGPAFIGGRPKVGGGDRVTKITKFYPVILQFQKL